MVKEWVQHPPSKALAGFTDTLHTRKKFPFSHLKTLCNSKGSFHCLQSWENSWVNNGAHGKIHRLNKHPGPSSPQLWEGRRHLGGILGAQVQLHPSSQGCLRVYSHLSQYFTFLFWGLSFWEWCSCRFLPFSRLCDLGGNFGHSNWSSHSIYMYYYKFMLLSWNSVLSFPFFEHLRCTTGNLQQNPASLAQNMGQKWNTSKDDLVPAPHLGYHLQYVLSNLNFMDLAGLTPG